MATVDQISRGRVDFKEKVLDSIARFGVGRSGFARSYEGYGVPYGESRERFQECLEIILAAWSNERFSYEGKYYTSRFNDVCVIPKPFQKPHPPLRVAATTSDTFPGWWGRPDCRSSSASGGWTAPTWCAAWLDTGRPGGPPATRATAQFLQQDVYLRIPVFVGESDGQAHADAQESTMRSYQRMARNFADSATVAGAAHQEPGAVGMEERLARGQRLADVTYEDLLRDRLAYGGPESVAALLREIVEELDLSGVIAETNVGGLIPKEKVLDSIARFGEEVVPVLRGLEA